MAVHPVGEQIDDAGQGEDDGERGQQRGGGAEAAQAFFQAVDDAGAAAGEGDAALHVLGEDGRGRGPLEPPQGGHRPAQRLEAGPAGGAVGEMRLGLPALARGQLAVEVGGEDLGVGVGDHRGVSSMLLN